MQVLCRACREEKGQEGKSMVVCWKMDAGCFQGDETLFTMVRAWWALR